MKATKRQWEVINESTERRILNGGPFKTLKEALHTRQTFLEAHKNTPGRSIYIYRLEKIDGQWVGEAIN